MPYKDYKKQLASQRRHYKKNKKVYIIRARKYRNKHRDEVRKLINSLKDVPCKDCNKKFHPCVMDFDHRNPNKKTKNVSEALDWSIDKIKKEIAKCDIVCANCHRIRTHLNK